MSIRSSITAKLDAAFSPERLEVINESHLHAGHQPGYDGEGETHMRIRIVSSAFAGMNRVARHRAINDLVKAEFDAGLHALAVEAAAPGEATRW
ncbi:BolA family protein [Shinella zoogloeoides]|jgi:BolA protein|uniref:BolA family protein n=1 Tax=Shinella zoogloeoides TaxID=352475 RepID=UPI00273CFE01|nr:BolA family protein [Shinella zoogloeoides]WLR92105.1 BolA family protein [Shinella zoogloeoides]